MHSLDTLMPACLHDMQSWLMQNVLVNHLGIVPVLSCLALLALI